MTETAPPAFDPYHLWLGIPSAEQPPNAYRLLGIACFESNLDVIATAADRQMSHVRSFQTGKYAKQSQELLNEIARAKVHLLHPEKKAAYDAKLKQVQQAIAAADAKVDSPEGPPAAATKKRKLPVALPLEPNYSPKKSSKKAAPSSSNGQQAKPTAEVEGPNKNTRTAGRPILFGALGGVFGVACVVGWLLARGSTDGSPVPEEVSVASVDVPPMRASEVNIEAFESSRKTHESPPPESSNGPKWQPTESSPLPETVMGANTETTALPDVRSTETTSDTSPAESAEDEETSAKNLPNFDQIEPVKAESPIDPASPEAKQVDSGTTVSAKLIKQDIPGIEEQKALKAQLISVYKTADAKSPGELVKLAREMVQAAKTIEVAKERYALLVQAAELAESAGDPTLTLQILDILGNHFKIDICQQREQFLGRYALAARSTEQYALLVAVSDRAIKQALACQNGSSALRVSDIVLQACQRLPGREFRKDALAKREWVESLSQCQQEVLEAEKIIAERPDDAAAHLTLARWYCFQNDDWKEGLPHLSKSIDEPLKALANEDSKLAESGDVEAQVRLGDAWWDLAQKRKGEEHDPLLLRAGYWYQKALDGSLTGLRRIRLEKRLEELVEIRNGYRLWLAQNSLEAPTDSLWNAATP